MILEELMLDLMYYVPGNKKVKDLWRLRRRW